MTRHMTRVGMTRVWLSAACALMLMAGQAHAATFTVTQNNDGGAGSLRQAIIDANATTAADTITFNLPSGSTNIGVGSTALPIITNPLTIDETTQPGSSTVMVYLSNPANAINGFEITAANCGIKGLTISGFAQGSGIFIHDAGATGNRVESCYIGSTSNISGNGYGVTILNATGNTIITNSFEGNGSYGNALGVGVLLDGGATGNLVQDNDIGADISNAREGVLINNASNNTIGGNVISHNGQAGVLIINASSGNKVQGNNIGTDFGGTSDLGNGGDGVFISGSGSGNLIGGTSAGARNVISGNGKSGIAIITPSTGNTVQGNYIGTNGAGTSALGNTLDGIFINGPGNTIGGTTGGAGNLISGNLLNGIVISDAAASGNTVQGNKIGTDAGGAAALGNGRDGSANFDANGVKLQLGANHNLIGGTTAQARNVISGNVGLNNNSQHDSGVLIVNAGTDNNTVQGNYIGTNAAGTAALGNAEFGVDIEDGGQNNLIGGAAAAPGQAPGNVISGNGFFGVALSSSNNTVQGNLIGTNAAGTAALPNPYGVVTGSGSDNTLIGGTNANERNVISGNSAGGLSVNYVPVRVQGNDIGLDISGKAALPNGGYGIEIRSGAHNCVIGLDTRGNGRGNRIAFNQAAGVYLSDAIGILPLHNTIRGNSIFNNTGLGIDLAPTGSTGVAANDPGDGDSGPNGLQNYPVITGVSINGGQTTLNGTFNSTPNTNFLLDFYANTAADPSKFGEGETYLGSAPVLTNSAGNATFSKTFSGSFYNKFFSATATSSGTTNSGDTSEFSADVQGPRTSLPQTGTITPSSAIDAPRTARTFRATYTDGDGANDINLAALRIGGSDQNSANSLLCVYNATTNKLSIYNDGATALIGSVTPGTATVLSNGQGNLNCGATTVSKSGNTLTVNWNVSATGAFAGTRQTTFLFVRDTKNLSEGYTAKGTWTINGNARPSTVSVSPASISTPVGVEQFFTTTFSDPNGFKNLQFVTLRLGGSGTDSGNAMVCVYNVQNNKLYLFDDAGNYVPQADFPGRATVLQNSRGSLNCARTTVTGSGNTLTVKWSVKAKATFVGSNAIALLCADRANLRDGYDTYGTWTVTYVDGVPASSVVSTATASGQNVNLVFTGAAPQSDYTVTVNGAPAQVTSTSVQGSKVELQLAEPFHSGDKVVVTWPGGSTSLVAS